VGPGLCQMVCGTKFFYSLRPDRPGDDAQRIHVHLLRHFRGRHPSTNGGEGGMSRKNL